MSEVISVDLEAAATPPKVPEMLKYKIYERERSTEETGHYWAVRELTLKKEDPMKYERSLNWHHPQLGARRHVAEG